MKHGEVDENEHPGNGHGDQHRCPNTRYSPMDVPLRIRSGYGDEGDEADLQTGNHEDNKQNPRQLTRSEIHDIMMRVMMRCFA